MTKFWMVYGLHKAAPTMRHKTRPSAVQEASRLARKSPGDSFFVLEAMQHVMKRDVDVTELHEEPHQSRADSDTPF